MFIYLTNNSKKNYIKLTNKNEKKKKQKYINPKIKKINKRSHKTKNKIN